MPHKIRESVTLSAPLSEKVVVKETDSYLDVRALLLYPGDYISMTGEPLTVTTDMISKVKETHNSKVHSLFSFMKTKTALLDLQDVETSPLQKDHVICVDNSVGYLTGELTVDDKGKLFCTMRLRSPEAIHKVKCGLYKNVSINFIPSTGEILEVSFVVIPAVAGAGLVFGKVPAQIKSTISLDEILCQRNHILSQITEIENQKLITNEVENLTEKGWILPHQKDFYISKLLSFKNIDDVKSSIRLFKSQPKRLEFNRPFSQNQLSSFIGVMNKMSKSETLREVIDEAVAFSKKASSSPTDGNEDVEEKKGEGQGKDDKELKAPMSKSEYDEMEDMCKSGKMKELKKHLRKFCTFSFKDEDEDDDEDKKKRGKEFSAYIEKTDKSISDLQEKLEANSKLVSQALGVNEQNGKCLAEILTKLSAPVQPISTYQPENQPILQPDSPDPTTQKE